MTTIGWHFSNFNLGTGGKIIVAEDGRNIGVMYGPNVNPRAAQDAEIAAAAPKLQAALAELTAAFDDALSATDVAGAMYSARVNAAREAAEAALAATRIVEPRR